MKATPRLSPVKRTLCSCGTCGLDSPPHATARFDGARRYRRCPWYSQHVAACTSVCTVGFRSHKPTGQLMRHCCYFLRDGVHQLPCTSRLRCPLRAPSDSQVASGRRSLPSWWHMQTSLVVLRRLCRRLATYLPALDWGTPFRLLFRMTRDEGALLVRKCRLPGCLRPQSASHLAGLLTLALKELDFFPRCHEAYLLQVLVRYSSFCVSRLKRLRSSLVTEMHSNPRSLQACQIAEFGEAQISTTTGF